MEFTPANYRAIRLSLGLTQKALADHLGVQKNTIARRERGELRIDQEAWLALGALRVRLLRR